MRIFRVVGLHTLLIALSAAPALAKETPPLRWRQMPVAWSISADGARDLTWEQAATAAFAAFDTWTRVDGTEVRFDYQGDAAAAAVGYRPERDDNRNVVVWSRQDWMFEPDALAVTAVFYDDNGTLLDADIVVNERHYLWHTGDHDLQNALTHEVGHLLGLEHVADETATMFAGAHVGERNKRTLDEADRQALRARYPGPARVAPPPPVAKEDGAHQTSAPLPAVAPRPSKLACAAAPAGGGHAWPLLLLVPLLVRRRRS